MARLNRLRVFGTCLAMVVLALSLVLVGTAQLRALAEPLTPEAAQYEIDRADSPEEAGARLQQKARAHKEEIKVGPKPVQGLAKRVAGNTKGVFQLAGERIQETLEQNGSNLSKDSSSN